MPLEPRHPVAIWSSVGLLALYISADSFFAHGGLASPVPLHLISQMVQDPKLDSWEQRMKLILPALIATAVIGAWLTILDIVALPVVSTNLADNAMALRFNLAKLVPRSDQRWLSWVFVTGFHFVPLVVIAYFASESLLRRRSQSSGLGDLL
jgi:hypothetical protein